MCCDFYLSSKTFINVITCIIHFLPKTMVTCRKIQLFQWRSDDMKTDTWAVPSKTKFQVISGFRLQDTRPRVGLIASSPNCCACPPLASLQKRFLLLLVLPPLASYFGFVSFSDSYLTLYAPCLVIKTHSMPFLVGFSHICSF